MSKIAVRSILSITAVILAALFAAWIMGNVLVFDESGNVKAAYISSNGKLLQKLRHLPGDVFYTIPQAEGSITIVCKDRSVQTWGYVTGHMNVRMKVKASPSGCGKLMDLED